MKLDAEVQRHKHVQSLFTQFLRLFNSLRLAEQFSRHKDRRGLRSTGPFKVQIAAEHSE